MTRGGHTKFLTGPAGAHQQIKIGQIWSNVTCGSTSHAATAGRVIHRFTAPAAPSSRHGGTGRHRNSTWPPTGASGTSRWRKAKETIDADLLSTGQPLLRWRLSLMTGGRSQRCLGSH